jgi:hypothetical protein
VLLALMNLLWRSLDGGTDVGAEESLAEHQAIDDGSVLLVGATYALASGEVTLLD